MSKIGEDVIEQRVSAFKRKLAVFENEDSPKMRSKRTTDVLMGGQDELSPPPPAPARAREYVEKFGTPTRGLLERIREIELTKSNQNQFFSQPGVVSKFGVSTTFLARLGFDSFSQSYKLYIKRDNGSNSPPTVAMILFKELREILDHMKITLGEIDHSIAEKNPKFHYGPEEEQDSRILKFWQHDDCYYSSTLRFRMRFIHARQDRYQIFINSPTFDNSRFEGYFGPKLIFCRADLEEFIEVAEAHYKSVDKSEM